MSSFAPLLRRHYTRSVAITIEGRLRAPSAPRSTPSVVPVAVRLARKRLPSATGYLARSRRAAPRRSRGHRHQHVRQGHQARLGLAGPLAGGGRSRHGARRSARTWPNVSRSTRTTSCAPVRAAPPISPIARRCRRWSRASSPRGAMHAASHRNRSGRHASIAISHACSKISPASFRCSTRWSSGDAAARSACRCRGRPGGRRVRPAVRARARGRRARRVRAGRPSLDARLGRRARRQSESHRARTAPHGPRDPTLDTSALPGSHAPRRRAQYGLSLQFEARPDDDELGRLVDSTIWVNDAHPAFARATRSRSVGYHLALTVALALAPLAVTPADEHRFVTRFLAEWGNVSGARSRRGARRQRPSRSRGRAPS